ncbi:MAG: hypothetical protein M1826_000082 [Phylliscum demangeonii]|nr:MAG: hypothetical protein M1826_000082 [Phylliscum demangeonii]
MRVGSLAVLAAMAGLGMAARPSNVSICDYYTGVLLQQNTAENQMKLLTLVVNTAVIGNYSSINVGIAVPGILAQGQRFNGTDVNLLPYFSGGFASTNDGGSSGVSQNFLDDGGAAPLKDNKPANGMKSNQYTLLTHLYQYFGVLLGCSLQGAPAYPAYSGDASQYQVHKFMDLDSTQIGYFITQVGLSAASFGVSTDDVTLVGKTLGKVFGYRCSPPTTVVPAQGPQLQSICLDPSCPLDANATCSLYENNGVGIMPANATTAASGNAATNSSSSSSSSTTTSKSGSATASATGGASSSSASSGAKSAAAVTTARASAVFGLLALAAVVSLGL